MFRKLIKRHPVKSQRALEILPGLFSWSLILFPVWGSFVIPSLVAYYIIAFDIYWLYQSIWTGVLALVAHYYIKAAKEFDWLGDVKSFPDWDQVHHVIIIPTYQEPLTTLRRTIKALKNQTLPKKMITVVLSFESREGQAAQVKAKKLTQEFGNVFANFITTFHPDLAGEIKGKSSNTAWGAKVAKKLVINQQKYPLGYITITSEDADAILHPSYLACLTFKFLDQPQRYLRIWQPAIQYYNNIWQVPAVSRVFNRVSSVVQMAVLLRRDRLINFSTYSTSLKMADRIGYWDTNVIPEDYRFFFKAFFKLKGKVEVEPIFLPVLADAAQSTSFFRTMRNQYEQAKRWAWGSSDDAYIIKQWLTNKTVPFWEKTMRSLHVLKDHFLWPVNWFAITIGANLPPLLNPQFQRTSLGKSLPQVASTILTISLFSIILIFFVDAKQKPGPQQGNRLLHWLGSVAELILLPVAGLIFSALPGIDAHTRLMFGRYIEYRVTEKV